MSLLTKTRELMISWKIDCYFSARQQTSSYERISDFPPGRHGGFGYLGGGLEKWLHAISVSIHHHLRVSSNRKGFVKKMSWAMHIAIQENLDGQVVEWIAKVGDDQYQGSTGKTARIQ